MKRLKADFRYYFKFVLFLLVVLSMVGAVAVFNQQTYHLPIFNGTDGFSEPGWYFGEKGGKMEPTDLRDQHWIEPGITYVLETDLVYSGEGDSFPSAFFTVGNYEIRVFLDGENVFSYTRAERGLPRVKSMGGAAFSVPLGQNCQGRHLSIELATSMDYASLRRMPGIQLGDHSAQIHRLFLSNLPSMLITMAILLVTVVLVILGNSTPQKRWAYLHFSLFALVIAVYRSSQDLFFMYMWANPLVTVSLEFFSMVACPLPVLLSYRSELKPHYRTTFHILITLSAMNLILQLVLHFTGLMDVVQMLEFTHLWILISAVILVWAALRVRKIDRTIHCMRKMIPILVGAVLDFAMFYILSHVVGPGSFFVVGNFIGLGLLISLSMMVWEARKEREQAYLEIQRSQLFEQLAYHDGLTGLENRTAFTKEVQQIEKKVRGERGLRVIAADLNDLKVTNDTLGHAAGDRLIRRAADLLQDCFSPWGHVFRIGGDEFCAFLYEVSDAQWEQLRKTFYEELEKRNAGQENLLSIAVGSAEMTGTIADCIQQADRQMYRDKARIKKQA